MTWSIVVAIAIGTYALRLVGFAFSERELPERLRAFADFVPAALLAGLVVVQTVGRDGAVVLDARLVGVAAAALAVWRDASLAVVIIVGVAATAAARLLHGLA